MCAGDKLVDFFIQAGKFTSIECVQPYVYAAGVRIFVIHPGTTSRLRGQGQSRAEECYGSSDDRHRNDSEDNRAIYLTRSNTGGKGEMDVSQVRFCQHRDVHLHVNCNVACAHLNEQEICILDSPPACQFTSARPAHSLYSLQSLFNT